MIEAMVPMLAQVTDEAHPMVQKLALLWPEVVLFVTTFIVMVMGLSPTTAVRRACGMVSVVGLVLAGLLALVGPEDFGLLVGYTKFAKVLIACVGVLLALLVAGTVDRELEEQVEKGGTFEGLRANVGEFYSFMLFSLTGLMLCAGADDLIWLFLALELTSLPTYVMVSISTTRAKSQEAGVKYFFLGAFGAAMFLYGFALLYGAAGTTALFAPAGEASIAAHFAANGVGTIGLAGLALALVGVSFKIAAVPMHFYTPDVYEGAASTVSAFLAFVPKAAGFLAIIALVSTVGWSHGAAGTSLPEEIRVVLWVMAALTMTVGNVMALLQDNVKRMLAYSSIAHSGYMLVGVVVGPGAGVATLPNNGLAATLFYLLCYGFMNLGAFAVLACLERERPDGAREEIETVDDLKGLCARRPALGWTMVLCALSLLGFPPLLGFFGKVFLFTSAISAGEMLLVIIMAINSAIGAFYYLRLVGASFLDEPTRETEAQRLTPFGSRVVAAVASGASVVVLVVATSWLMERSNRATEYTEPATLVEAPADRPPVVKAEE